ncbi:MAG: hypothetical protein KGM15_07070 [Pseudomonadota bacterium]|nr:hypothetical protein [Pseudomonadota bacterium]
METIKFMGNNWSVILHRTAEHVMLVGVAIGILITQSMTAADRVLHSQLPIIRNNYTAIMSIDPALREAARGVRNVVVLNIAIAAIAVYIGAHGLSTLISRGISQTDSCQLLTGASCISVLVIAADRPLFGLQRRLTSSGLRNAL